MKVQFDISNTYIDEHSMKMTKEALEEAAEQLNIGRKPSLNIEHDLSLPPFGKILKAWVEPIGDGEFKLVASCEIFEEYQIINLENISLIKQESKEDESPFTMDRNVAHQEVYLSYDRVNFASDEDRIAFFQELRLASSLDFQEALHVRKALIPDPEIIIHLSELLIQFLIARKLLERAGDRLLDLALEEVEKFYSLLRATVVSMAKYSIPKNRPITYIFKMSGNPQIELVACSTNPDLIISALTEEKLIEVIQQVDYYRELLRAEQIQFILSDEGLWSFNYLLTNKGAVIGTKQSFNRRNRRIERIGIDVPKLHIEE